MQEFARRIAKVSQESKLPIVEDEYVQSFKVELMDAVVQWCRGASFSEICKVCLYSSCRDYSTDMDYLKAHRPVRRQLDSRLPTFAGVDPPNEPSRESHR